MRKTAAPSGRVPARRRSIGSPHLSQEQIALLERQLLRERARVLRSSAALQELVDVQNLKLRGDFADVSTDVASRENASLLASRAGEQFRVIEEALARLRNDPESFGRCNVCQQPISFERLDLIPTTRTCQAHAL